MAAKKCTAEEIVAHLSQLDRLWHLDRDQVLTKSLKRERLGLNWGVHPTVSREAHQVLPYFFETNRCHKGVTRRMLRVINDFARGVLAMKIVGCVNSTFLIAPARNIYITRSIRIDPRAAKLSLESWMLNNRAECRHI